MIFIWVFLPVVIIGNAILNFLPLSPSRSLKAKNIFLLLASLFFYAWGGIYYLLLMLAVIGINYLGGLSIKKAGRKKTMVLIGTLSLNLGLLFYFKYFNLFIHTVEHLRGMESGGMGLKEVIFFRP